MIFLGSLKMHESMPSRSAASRVVAALEQAEKPTVRTWTAELAQTKTSGTAGRIAIHDGMSRSWPNAAAEVEAVVPAQMGMRSVVSDYRQSMRCCCTRRDFAEHWSRNRRRVRRVGTSWTELHLAVSRRTAGCMRHAVIAGVGTVLDCTSSTMTGLMVADCAGSPTAQASVEAVDTAARYLCCSADDCRTQRHYPLPRRAHSRRLRDGGRRTHTTEVPLHHNSMSAFSPGALVAGRTGLGMVHCRGRDGHVSHSTAGHSGSST
jgi:hypothetical protein